MLSIIMPVYNTEKYLAEAIESVINQSGELELILVDDGSTDLSLSICNSYASRDSRIKVIHTENMGVSNARNIGVAAACGDYIQFVDSDDKLVQGSLEKIFQMMSHNADVILFSYQTFGKIEEKIIYRDKYPGNCEKTIEEMVKTGSIVSCWNKIYKRDIIKNILFNVDLRYAEDYSFNLDAFLLVKSITVIPDILYMYRINDTSLSSNYDEINFVVAKDIREKTINLLHNNGCIDIACANRNYAYNMSAIVKRMSKDKELNFFDKKRILKNYCTNIYIESVCEYYPGLYARLLKTRMYNIVLIYLLFLNRR